VPDLQGLLAKLDQARAKAREGGHPEVVQDWLLCDYVEALEAVVRAALPREEKT
jgi:hypothetical protein